MSGLSKKTSIVITGCMVLFRLFVIPAQAQQATDVSVQMQVSVQILPFAELRILDEEEPGEPGEPNTALLYLQIPQAGSTIPPSGVTFLVRGNANASVSAAPDAFIWIPGESSFMGKALLGSEEIGYRIELRFPRTGVPGSPTQSALLPGYEAAGTSALSANLALTGGEREGVVHIEASHEWTDDGGFPLPGIYVAEVVLTLTVDGV